MVSSYLTFIHILYGKAVMRKVKHSRVTMDLHG